MGTTTMEQIRLHAVFTVIAVIAMLLAFSLSAYGQNSSRRLPGIVDRPNLDYEPAELRRLREQQTVEDEVPAPAFDQPADADQIVATLNEVMFQGNTKVSDRALAKIAEPYLEREVTVGDVAQLKFDVRRHYFDKGYVLVRVVTPPQDLDDGVLDVVIYEAVTGKVELNNSALAGFVAEHYAERVKVGEVFKERRIESAISDISQLHDVTASINLKPGENTGETDVVLNIDPADEDRQSINIDNYGSELTGEIVAQVRLEKNNLLGFGEQFGLGFRKSEDELETLFVDATSPIGISNVLVELQALTSDSELGDRLAALDSRGETDIVSVSLSKALVNTRVNKTTARIGVEMRKHESFIGDVTESLDEIGQAAVEVTTILRSPRTVFYGSLSMLRGLSGLSDEIGEADASRALGDPEASIVRASAYFAVHPSAKDSIALSLYGQHSDDILLSSDMFGIGGYGSVRGFAPAQAIGESGYQASLLLSHRFGRVDGWGLTTGAFYDYGKVFNELPGQTLDDELKSAGLQLRVSRPDERIRVTFDWARTIGDYRSPDVDDDRYYLSLYLEF